MASNLREERFRSRKTKAKTATPEEMNKINKIMAEKMMLSRNQKKPMRSGKLKI